MEIDYLDKLFDVVYRKFLNAINHIENHPTLQDTSSSGARGKCSVLFLETGSYSTFSHCLSLTEELFLDKLLVALENMNSILHHKFKRRNDIVSLCGCSDGVSSLMHEVLVR